MAQTHGSYSSLSETARKVCEVIGANADIRFVEAMQRRNGETARGVEVHKEATVKGGGDWEFRALLDTTTRLDVIYLYISRLNEDAPLSASLAA